MIIKFRPITLADHAFLKIAYRSTREQELSVSRLTTDQKNQFIEFQFNAQHAHYTNEFKGAEFNIITVNNVNAGRLYVWETTDEIRLIDIILLPKYRGKGIGSRILKNLIKNSEESGKVLNLHVLKTNTASRFYTKLGFTVNEEKESHYFMSYTPTSVN